MKTSIKLNFILFMLVSIQAVNAQELNDAKKFGTSKDLQISQTQVTYNEDLAQFVFSIEVNGKAGASVPKVFGQMDGAPVLGYVFPTSLSPTDVGFSDTEGIVALALTSHPDFDDTPLWDENNNADFADDGIVWHPHWVVLNKDERVAGGLSVKQFDKQDSSVKLPPTNPGMPMYMDSPGFPVVTNKNKILVIVPSYRMNHVKDFQFDAVTAYMQVNTSDNSRPLLGVYKVYSIASGELSLPYKVKIQ